MSSALHTNAAYFDDAKIQVELTPLPAQEAFAAQWQDLEARADGSFFLSWAWISTWLATIDCQPHLMIARLDGEVVGLALVHARLKTRHRLLPVWTLYLHQTGDDDQDVITTEYNDFLTDRRHQQRVRQACLRFLIDHGEIGGHDIGEILLGGLIGARRADIDALGRPVHERALAGSAFVDLVTLRQSGKAFLETVKATTARRIRRSIALYQERGDLELKVADNVDEALDFFERCGELHQARWTARRRPGAFAYPFYTSFHRRLIRTALPLGLIELVQISVAGEPIGYLYNFLDQNSVRYYFSGFRF